MKNKLSVALDVDGVLADFTTASANALRSLGVEPAEGFEIFGGDRELEDRVVKPGFCVGLPEYVGARTFLASMSECYDVSIVTAPHRMPGWCDERFLWLERLGVDRHKVNFVKEKWRFDADVFVDDNFDNVLAWSLAHPSKLALLFDRSWNRQLELPRTVRLQRVGSYDDIERLVEIETGIR